MPDPKLKMGTEKELMSNKKLNSPRASGSTKKRAINTDVTKLIG